MDKAWARVKFRFSLDPCLGLRLWLELGLSLDFTLVL
jgi:hypothetical protein